MAVRRRAETEQTRKSSAVAVSRYVGGGFCPLDVGFSSRSLQCVGVVANALESRADRRQGPFNRGGQSRTDFQRGNLVALETEEISKVDRAAETIASDDPRPHHRLMLTE
jgi:hypothetical protein